MQNKNSCIVQNIMINKNKIIKNPLTHPPKNQKRLQKELINLNYINKRDKTFNLNKD